MSSDHWFEELADHMGSAYLRYSFTRGTVHEVDWLVDRLDLQPGTRLLDVGCGPGRHAHELARRGTTVHGIDISRTFVELARRDAPPGATFERVDARRLEFDSEFDVVISICQGAFGLGAGPGPRAESDDEILRGMARAVRPGGRVVVTAFNAYFQVRYLDDGSRFDPATGVHHEHTEVLSPAGSPKPVQAWTTCFTPRELRLMASGCGLAVESLHGAEPGRWSDQPPSIELPEYLMVCRRDVDGDQPR